MSVVEWMRPSQINKDAKLFVNGVDEGDVIQVSTIKKMIFHISNIFLFLKGDIGRLLVPWCPCCCCN